MKTSLLLYGEPAEVANELCSCYEPEEVGHVDLIAALGNALNRIAKLEAVLRDQKPEPVSRKPGVSHLLD